MSGSKFSIYKQDVSLKHSTEYIRYESGLHFHDGFEVHLTLTDQIRYFIEDKHYLVNRGTITVINKGEFHEVISPKNAPYERYILSFKPEYILEYTSLYLELLSPFTRRNIEFDHCTATNEEELRKLIACFNELEEIIQNKNAYAQDFHKKLTLMKILLYISEIYAKKDKTLIKTSVDEKAMEIIAYINKNLRDRLLLNNIAKEFFISKSSLINLFKKTIGMTPGKYVSYARIMNARKHLINGVSIAEVCDLIGFEDESSFIRNFKKTIGTTPKKYAKLAMHLE